MNVPVEDEVEILWKSLENVLICFLERCFNQFFFSFFSPKIPRNGSKLVIDILESLSRVLTVVPPSGPGPSQGMLAVP